MIMAWAGQGVTTQIMVATTLMSAYSTRLRSLACETGSFAFEHDASASPHSAVAATRCYQFGAVN